MWIYDLQNLLADRPPLQNFLDVAQNGISDDLFWDQEIDEMIETVDRNEDWKISYSEFRVMCYIHILRVYVQFLA